MDVPRSEGTGPPGPGSARVPWPVLVYGLLAPLVPGWGAVLGDARIPGGDRTDLWDALWSLWMFQDALWAGNSILETRLLGFPDGGAFLVADPLNALLAAPLVPALGLPTTWTLLVLAHLAFSARAAHALGEEVVGRPGAGWIAGLSTLAAPVLVSAIQNGTSESMGGGWLALALWASLRAVRRGGLARQVGAAVALALAAAASWYGGVCAFLGTTCLLVLGEGTVTAPTRWRRLLPPLVTALALVLPLAWLASSIASAPGSLVGIKGLAELATVRRTTGAADPRGWFLPLDFRSPDFRLLSRYGENFVHCHYLGWSLICCLPLVAFSPNRRRGTGWLAWAAIVGAILAMGPVMVMDGQALILGGDRAIPLPYLLLERLPGFRSLSLIYRLGQLTSLAVAVLAAAALAGRGRWPTLLAVASGLVVFAEHRVLAPTHGLPESVSSGGLEPLQALERLPDGAVLNFPVVGGRRYLYEQTAHRKPLAATLNFPNNRAGQRTWKVLLGEAGLAASDPIAYGDAIRRLGCPGGVRYLVVHLDPTARPDLHDTAVRALQAALEPVAAASDVRIYDLCEARVRDSEPTSP